MLDPVPESESSAFSEDPSPDRNRLSPNRVPDQSPVLVVEDFDLHSTIVFNRRASDSGIPDRVWEDGLVTGLNETKMAATVHPVHTKYNVHSVSMSVQKRKFATMI